MISASLFNVYCSIEVKVHDWKKIQIQIWGAGPEERKDALSPDSQSKQKHLVDQELEAFCSGQWCNLINWSLHAKLLTTLKLHSHFCSMGKWFLWTKGPALHWGRRLIGLSVGRHLSAALEVQLFLLKTPYLGPTPHCWDSNEKYSQKAFFYSPRKHQTFLHIVCFPQLICSYVCLLLLDSERVGVVLFSSSMYQTLLSWCLLMLDTKCICVE